MVILLLCKPNELLRQFNLSFSEMKEKVKIDFPLLLIKFLTDDFEPEKINV